MEAVHRPSLVLSLGVSPKCKAQQLDFIGVFIKHGLHAHQRGSGLLVMQRTESEAGYKAQIHMTQVQLNLLYGFHATLTV